MPYSLKCFTEKYLCGLTQKIILMQETGIKNPSYNLSELSLNPSKVNWNLSPEELTSQTVALGQGTITDMGALAVSTGKFTGRSPKDKFTVKDALTENSVDWSEINIAISSEHFDKIYIC